MTSALTKKCNQCGDVKEIFQFHKDGKRGYRGKCKHCVNENNRISGKNKTHGAKQTIARRECYEELKRLAGNCCFECKSVDRIEFGHYDHESKYRTKHGKALCITQLSVKRMKEEVKKGRFLCHRCHSPKQNWNKNQ